MTADYFWNSLFLPWRLRAWLLEAGVRFQLCCDLSVCSGEQVISPLKASAFSIRPFSIPSQLQQTNQKGQMECATAEGPDGVIVWTELLTSPLCRQGKDCASLKGLKLPSHKLLRGWGCRNWKDAIFQGKGAL